jgi:hypothetical protein
MKPRGDIPKSPQNLAHRVLTTPELSKVADDAIKRL